jgi:hypothetical protein
MEDGRWKMEDELKTVVKDAAMCYYREKDDFDPFSGFTSPLSIVSMRYASPFELQTKNSLKYQTA